ncbi:methyltransferase family protein [Antricoccus suffuscus]|uniref:Methyltransferase family protein n=1 Tax=Antricoccus suffuscus TaxID=1629062 RepID=A0A2T0Z8R8_9ACTN|nr:class I SAM-dependent methyltransferase [Antricoccus suffuscus]PRZ32736.1 methyltransferase family protein [Antricoccus suffuscus]
MPEGHEYAEDYYDFSRPESGIKSKVDTIRDSFIRRQVLKRVSGGALLDVGCGIGMFLETMAGEFDLYGVDISDYAIKVCAQRLPDAKLAVGSLIEGLPFDRTFDVISAINVMEHLEDPLGAASVVRSRLRPGGLFVTHLPTIGNKVQARLYKSSYDQDPTHIYRPSGPAYQRLVSSAGFKCTFQTYAPFVGAPLWRVLKAHPAHLAIFEAL